MHPLALTRQGSVAGEVGRHAVNVFRGIPYARAPLGALRFMAPQEPAAWSGTRDARAFGSPAAQDLRLMVDLHDCSEDALFLNVWTPQVDRARRPVLVFIHGGGFSVGASNQVFYDGASLAHLGDAVVVSMNYRLGALGFAYLGEVLGSAASRVSSNVGLRDQVAALRWVRDNIAEFGGDPENVTVFGESAGAMSLCTLLAVPSARGLFRRAIAQSGAAHHAITPANATRVAAAFLRALEVNSADPERLWTASADEIVAAQVACRAEQVQKGPPGKLLPQNLMTLIPVVDGDFLPEHPLQAITAGCASEIDLLIGTNRDEWNYFLFLSEPDKRQIDERVLQKLCERRVPGHGDAALAAYRGLLGHDVAPWQIYSALESDRIFHVPAERLAEAQSTHVRRTFSYLFDYPSPLFDSQMGSCHALDLPFVFGTLDTQFGHTFAGERPEASVLSNVVQHAWLQFARSGDPSCEQSGSWQPYDTTTRRSMRLGLSCGPASDVHAALRAFWQPLH
jgi:para-nitrobenzyl esterase